MIKKKVRIKNKLGLHARAASKFVNIANRYRSKVKIIKNNDEIDGKSILGILTLAAGQGSEIILEVEGEDEDRAFQALEDLINNKFHEKE